MRNLRQTVVTSQWDLPSSDSDENGEAPLPAQPSFEVPPTAAAARLPMPRRQRRGIPWGPFEIAPLVSGNRQQGWGATCGRHRDSVDPLDRQCKKHFVYGKREPLTDEQCRRRLKKWLLRGLHIPTTDACCRSLHMSENVRAYSDDETEEELEAQLVAALRRAANSDRCVHV